MSRQACLDYGHVFSAVNEALPFGIIVGITWGDELIEQ